MNDIDHFSAIQLEAWNINEKNEIITYIEAFDVVEWFEKNKAQVEKLPPALRQKLAGMDEEDNPVVVILTLKKS